MTQASRKVLLLVSLILVLMLVDQGVKLLIDHFPEPDADLMQVTDTIHIHPYLNAQDREEMLPYAEKLSLNIDFLMVLQAIYHTLDIALLWLFAYFCDRFFFWDTHRKRYPILTVSIVCLMLAGLLCHSYIDELFRGGTPDFICIAQTIEIPKQVGDHIHMVTAPRHRIFDFADIYVLISLALTFVRLILWLIDFLKLNTTDPKNISHKLRHPIQNIRFMKERGSS